MQTYAHLSIYVDTYVYLMHWAYMLFACIFSEYGVLIFHAYWHAILLWESLETRRAARVHPTKFVVSSYFCKVAQAN